MAANFCLGAMWQLARNLKAAPDWHKTKSNGVPFIFPKEEGPEAALPATRLCTHQASERQQQSFQQSPYTHTSHPSALSTLSQHHQPDS